ncbi:MAG: toxic anion resistance protein [Dehalococcoidia bacterium]
MTMSSPNPGSPGDGALKMSLDVDAVRTELSRQSGTPGSVEADVEQRASQYAETLLELATADIPAPRDVGDAVDTLGRELQLRAAQQSRMLLGPVKDLASRGGDGGTVASALASLRVEVAALDPNRLDFAPGWPTRLFGFIPAVGTPLKRYFSRYESAQVIIDDIIKSLETGRGQLRRDNATLADDQREMAGVVQQLRTEILFAEALDRQLDERVTQAQIGSPDRVRFMQEELQFPIRQRAIDLQQQLAVSQQGILASEIVIRNNRELIRGVDRSINVTVTALRTAVSVAFALAHQKIVLEKISAVGQTTSDLIAGTAARLRTQGSEIQAQSAQATLDLEQLRAAFTDINAALDEISRFRREALPAMAQTILEFDELSAGAEVNIQKLGPLEPTPRTAGE